MSEDGREPWLRAADPEPDTSNWVELYRKYIMIAAGVVIVAFAIAIWYAYDKGRGAAIGEAPLVKADATPIRIKPNEPGGLDVPDRDKLVYNRVSGVEGEEPVQLNAGPELPIDKPEAKLPEPTETQATEPLETVPEVADSTPVPPPADPEPAAAKPTAPTPAATPEPAKPATAGMPAAAGMMVQLGAFGTEAAATDAWKAAQKKFPGALGSLRMEIAPLQRTGQKPLYRLRGAGLADKAAADAVCATLKAGNQACFPASN